MAHENQKYKDTVFADLFYSDQSAKSNLLQLYNALFDTSLNDEREINLIRLEKTMFMNFYNDIAFSVGNKQIVLGEHQSTINNNMPLRNLLYIAREYEQFFPEDTRYKRRLVKIPRPYFFTFYNGIEKFPLEKELKLSDAFYNVGNEKDIPLELKVKIININNDLEKNHPILEKCKPLNEYSELVSTVRRFSKICSNPIERAVEDCIKRNILNEYLSRKGSEVVNMLIAEYNYDKDMLAKVEDGRAEGRAEAIYELVSDGDLNIETGMKKLGIHTKEEFRKNALLLGYKINTDD